MDITINHDTIKQVDCILLQKMLFLYNTLENGWTIKKKKNYMFLQKIMKVRKKYF